MIKNLLGMNPTQEKDGKGFIPSPLGLKFGVDDKTGFKPYEFKSKYSGDKKILVVCTEERYFEMTNGKLFSTGNNVQETAVPLMHLVNAGFDFDVATPTGSPAVLEEWSFPKKDEAVKKFMDENKSKFAKPLSIKDLVSKGFNDNSPYVGVFIPGGHGSMVGLPQDQNLGQLIRWVHNNDRHMVAVCHGPAALLAASHSKGQAYPYDGYSMAIFPDSVDRKSPSVGYLPGQLPWYQCEELEKHGVKFVNKKISGKVHVDRKLFTGDSPKACDELGRVVAESLLDAYA